MLWRKILQEQEVATKTRQWGKVIFKLKNQITVSHSVWNALTPSSMAIHTLPAPPVVYIGITAMPFSSSLKVLMSPVASHLCGDRFYYLSFPLSALKSNLSWFISLSLTCSRNLALSRCTYIGLMDAQDIYIDSERRTFPKQASSSGPQPFTWRQNYLPHNACISWNAQ